MIFSTFYADESRRQILRNPEKHNCFAIRYPLKHVPSRDAPRGELRRRIVLPLDLLNQGGKTESPERVATFSLLCGREILFAWRDGSGFEAAELRNTLSLPQKDHLGRKDNRSFFSPKTFRALRDWRAREETYQILLLNTPVKS